MPASAADPVSSVLKNAFASNGAGRNEVGPMHQTTGLIRGGNSSSVLMSSDSLDHEPTPFNHNGSTKTQSNNLLSGNSSPAYSPKLENGIRANAKRLLLSSQQCNVEFDEPTRHISEMGVQQAQNNMAGSNGTGKSRVIVINPHQKYQVRKM